MANPVDALHRKLGSNLRRLVDERGLTLAYVADFSGIGRGRMSEYVAGKRSPTIRTLSRIAATLGVTIKEILPD
jgi:transcriptional regulator with XRE-family HTH domain